MQSAFLKLPKEASLVMCDCGREDLHGAIVTPSGKATGEIMSKRRAQQYLDLMVDKKMIDETDAVRIREQIAKSGLIEPKPNSFTVCAGNCWIPVKHGHFCVDDHEQASTRFSVRGAIVELSHLKDQFKLDEEDVTRIEGEINAAGLPDASDIDLLLMAQDELQRRRGETIQGAASTISAVLVGAVERDRRLEQSPIFPKGIGTC